MQAVILAAGQGERLRPLTDRIPKCLVPFRGKPILEHLLETFHNCRIETIALATGYRAEMLKKYQLKKFFNRDYATTNMVVSLFASESFWKEDLIVSYGDIVFEKEVLEALMEEPHPFSVVVDRKWRILWEKRMADPLEDAETLKLDANGFIRELGKKPKSFEEIEGQYIGLFKIKKEILGAIRDFYFSLDRQALYDDRPFEKMFMTSFIQAVIDRLMPVKPVFIDGGWIEIDTPGDLEVN